MVNTANTVTTSATFFLPYQVRWLNDNSKVKIWEKSRRIGATYVQSYEDVRDAISMKVRNKPISVWFASADLTAAKEYILYCDFFARMFNLGYKNMGEQIIDESKGIKGYSLEFDNGARIVALSSNPKQFRSKGGKIVLDEFAFHDDQPALWKAAKPSATWGYPIRILSTDNGQNCMYYQFLSRVEKGLLKWSHHKTPIHLAVEEGLVDKIYDRPTTKAERDEWVAEQKEDCGDETTWLQEYCCVAVDEATAFLSYELITSCYEKCLLPLEKITGDLFVGYDVARKKDLSVITLTERLGSVDYIRKIITLEKMPYREQRKILYSCFKHPKFKHAAIDATGIGSQLAEDAQFDFGKYRVDAVTFTNKAKEEMAYDLRLKFEDKSIRIPDDEFLTNDLHSVKRIPTTTGVVKFDVDRSETDGHADRFWSLALAIFAGKTKRGGKPRVSGRKRHSKIGQNYGVDLSSFRGSFRGGEF